MDWYDDSPMFKSVQERRSAELAQLQPWTEWFSFSEYLVELEVVQHGIGRI